jgi:hypothetical protein
MKNPPFAAAMFCVQVIRVITALNGMRQGVQKLENAPDIPSLVGGFSIQYQFTASMALTRYAESFLQSSRMTSITLVHNNSANPEICS